MDNRQKLLNDLVGEGVYLFPGVVHCGEVGEPSRVHGCVSPFKGIVVRLDDCAFVRAKKDQVESSVNFDGLLHTRYGDDYSDAISEFGGFYDYLERLAWDGFVRNPVGTGLFVRPSSLKLDKKSVSLFPKTKISLYSEPEGLISITPVEVSYRISGCVEFGALIHPSDKNLSCARTHWDFWSKNSKMPSKE